MLRTHTTDGWHQQQNNRKKQPPTSNSSYQFFKSEKKGEQEYSNSFTKAKKALKGVVQTEYNTHIGYVHLSVNANHQLQEFSQQPATHDHNIITNLIYSHYRQNEGNYDLIMNTKTDCALTVWRSSTMTVHDDVQHLHTMTWRTSTLLTRRMLMRTSLSPRFTNIYMCNLLHRAHFVIVYLNLA